ncbi:unnamed protein product [Polarella glacialis]|uniref:Major facilitator superfamily (MFS) profile domain-containing protein n=1 Tax=Polarella glacialis TaxID=89957 RepID=A0A813GL60_POLGL|nr:unnamed protein product [Polarella glacialis]CAE8678841.1 unnamed protein product [Polarella glacialis]
MSPPLVALCTAGAEPSERSSQQSLAVAALPPVVKRLLLLQCVLSAANSWAFGALFDIDLYLLFGHLNTFVGACESVRGIAGLIAAVPLGYMADKYGRSFALRLSASFAPLIAVAAAIALLAKLPWLILLSVAAWSVCQQGMLGAMTAWLADLVPPGEARSRVMGWQVVAQQIGMCGGPLVQLLVIWLCGQEKDTWNPGFLAALLLSGLLLVALVTPLAWSSAIANADHLMRLRAEGPLQGSNSSLSGSQAAEPQEVEAEDVVPEWARASLRSGCKVNWVVVILLEASFTLTLLFAGMSAKYFSLFFKQDFGFDAEMICMLNAAFPLVVAGLVPLCGTFARRFGEVPGILLWTFLGGAMHVFLARASSASSAVAFFLLRQAFMKSRDPLYQTLIMDCLEKRFRGRFGSITSMRSVTWAGSSFIGGIVADRNHSDYRLVFDISGVLIATISTAVVLPLLYLVPRRR